MTTATQPTTISLSDGTTIEVRVNDFSYSPPDETGRGLVTATVSFDFDRHGEQYAGSRSLTRPVFDGLVDDDHVSEMRWHDWYGEEEPTPVDDYTFIESMILFGACRILQDQPELRDGALDEEDVQEQIAQSCLIARLERDCEDNLNWRLDVLESWGWKSRRFASLNEVVAFVREADAADYEVNEAA